MNEIFGEENFVGRWGKEKSKENLNKEIAAKQMNDGGFMIVEKYRKSSRMARSVWADKEDNSEKGTLLVKNLFDGKKYFDFPKSMEMVTKIIEIGSNPNDLILDFFAGSGTTAHAVMDLNKQDGGNRKYICVQLPERTDEKSEAYKSGYKTIADISKERIRRAGKKLVEIKKTLKKIESSNTLGLDLGEESIGYAIIEKGEYKTIDNSDNVQKLDIGFKVLKLEDSNFKQWQQIQDKDVKTLSEQLKLFVDPVSESATIENMVYELLLKSGKDLNSTIENKEGYFLVNGNEMALILEKVSQEIITQVISKYPKKVIALDKLFKGNDQLKTNTVLQMRDAGIEFKTI
jgi:adenine-specific DNA-methyltransferase